MKRNTIDRSVSERQLAETVEEAFELYGWLWCHYTFGPNRSGNGFRTHLRGHAGAPDYIACKNGRLMFVELKSQKGRLSQPQKLWRAELAKSCCEYYLVRPSGLDEFIEAIKYPHQQKRNLSERSNSWLNVNLHEQK